MSKPSPHHDRHAWIKQDSMGRNKTCDRCKIRVDRFGIGRSSYYVWSYSAVHKGDTQNGSIVPSCPGYPPTNNTVVTIPLAASIGTSGNAHDLPLVFTEVEPLGPQPAGDVGGDYQSTEAYSRRFAALLADGTYAMITISVFGEFYDADQHELRDLNGPYALTSLTEYMISTSADLSDPRTEEILSDLEYGLVEAFSSPATDDQARAACAALPVPTAWPARLAWQLPAGPLGTSENVEPRTDADIARDEQSREHVANN